MDGSGTTTIVLPNSKKTILCNVYREWRYLGQSDSASVRAQLGQIPELLGISPARRNVRNCNLYISGLEKICQLMIGQST